MKKSYLLSLILTGVLLNASAALSSDVNDVEAKDLRGAKFIFNEGRTLHLDNEVAFLSIDGYDGLKAKAGMSDAKRKLIELNAVDKVLVTGKMGYMTPKSWTDLSESLSKATKIKVLDLDLFWSTLPTDIVDRNAGNKAELLKVFKDNHGLKIRMLCGRTELDAFLIP